MRKKVDEANALVVKEREAARKAIEEAPPVIKEMPVYVEDTKKVESLTQEIDNLKVRILTYHGMHDIYSHDTLNLHIMPPRYQSSLIIMV